MEWHFKKAMQSTKRRIFKLYRLQKQPRTAIFSVNKSILVIKYMFIDREDSKNAFRIAVSLLVWKLRRFFNFDNFSTFCFINFFFFYLKPRGKSRQMALGSKGPTFLCFKLLFQNVISSLLLVQNGRFKNFFYWKNSKKIKVAFNFMSKMEINKLISYYHKLCIIYFVNW